MLRRLMTFIAVFLALLIGLDSSVSALKTDKSTPSLRVEGNTVLTRNGSSYIPEGISVYGGLEAHNFLANKQNINAQIEAAAKYWHTNTIRLQVAEGDLFSGLKKSQAYNPKFMDELKREVNFARSLNQAVVINDQTEFTDNTPSPTNETLRFWRVMSNQFGNQPFIIFDLFNEPRLGNFNASQPLVQSQLSKYLLADHPKQHLRRLSQKTIKIIWNVWKNGGWLNGYKYVGMQELVNSIRNSGADNLIWVEGPFWGQRLPSSSYLLSGTNLVYSYHHINLNLRSSWSFIGKFSKNKAVVDGEWAQYQSPWKECYTKAPLNTPAYLNYLKEHGIGLVAWSLQAGSLLKGSPSIIPSNLNTEDDPIKASDLNSPSQFNKKYLCNSQFGHGAGMLIKNYFLSNSKSI